MPHVNTESGFTRTRFGGVGWRRGGGAGRVSPGSIRNPGSGHPACLGSRPGVGKLAMPAFPSGSAAEQASSSPTGNRCSRSVVVTALRFNPQRCLPSLKYCSGCIRTRRGRLFSTPYLKAGTREERNPHTYPLPQIVRIKIFKIWRLSGLQPFRGGDLPILTNHKIP